MTITDLRPTLALARPGDKKADNTGRPGAGFGRLLRAASGAGPAAGHCRPPDSLPLIHACGSGDQTRSHFEAMATMERGVAVRKPARPVRLAGPSPRNRALEQSVTPAGSRPRQHSPPNRCVGTSQTTTLSSVADLRLAVPVRRRHGTRFEQALATAVFAGCALAEAGQEALSVLKIAWTHLPSRQFPYWTLPKTTI